MTTTLSQRYAGLATSQKPNELAPATYTYHINLDERGTFYADVRDANEKTVFEIQGFEIFEDGFMRDKHDLAGLQEYLVSLGILHPGDLLLKEA